MADQIPVVEAEFTLLKRHLGGTGARGSPRYRCALATLGRLFFADGGKPEDAWVHDLSKIGVGLNLSRPLEAGTGLTVRLKGVAGVLEVAANVVHSTPQVDGTWRVGCTFGRKLTADELDNVL